ncbi:MAG: hypothetical protein GY777_30815, partial [Candidatus Brocadiaceae bacterium]|nr:hypothetical protein [Candidatus Brocadiaceae bacterium]
MNLWQYRSKLQQNEQTVEELNYHKTVMRGFLFSLAFIVLCGLWITPALSAPKDKHRFPKISLLERARGERAIQVLADKLPEVAAFYGSTPEGFCKMLRRDHTSRIDIDGRLLFVDEAPEVTEGDEIPSVAEGAFPYDQTFELHSLPGSKRTIYLDFDGHTVTGTAWNTYYSVGTINSPAYDLDGDSSSFSNSEMDRIQDIWRLVSEDYAPFDVDVTTEDPGQNAITRSSSGDDIYGTRIVMTADNFAGCGCGGFAYVGVFDYVGSYYKPAFVFNESLVGAAEAVSHEAGHNLGLSHDGVSGGASYYQGQGSGSTGWAPIMGVGYYKQLVQWSKGEYTNANNTEDDIQIIQENGVLLLADDHGNDQGSATAIISEPDGTFSAQGVIERRTDVDVFSIISGGGDVSVDVNPAQLSPNLDILAELYDSGGALIASSNPVDSLPASINELALPAGEYFIMVDGVGKGDPQVTGYSDYASLGQYTISGSASNTLDSDGDGDPASTDCDDNDATRSSLNTEIPYNGVDDDCNALTLDDDLDGDGDPVATDCDDNDATRSSLKTEIPYNGIDDDCNALTLDDDLDGDGD